MQIEQRGNGDPLVLVPGLQGHWQFQAPTVEALSRRFRVLTFPLCDEPRARDVFDTQRGIDNYRDQIERCLDQSRLDRALVCGVSFGALPALRFAATRPERTTALILVSAPGPRFHLLPRHRQYARHPRVCGPLFLIESPRRLAPELRRTFPGADARWRFRLQQLNALLQTPPSLTRMAGRALAIDDYDRGGDAARVTRPTLIVHGERALDLVVNVDGTLEYVPLLRHVQTAGISDTGHLGSITRPEEFAAIVDRFRSTLPLSHDSAA